MGHNVYHSSYPENVDRKKVQREWDEFASNEDWQEGCSGLCQPIRWIKGEICENEDAAYDYIEKNDSGWYDQLAVRYYVYPDTKDKKLEGLQQKEKELTAKLSEATNAIHYLGCKSQFVGCKECGSKLNTKLLTEKLRTNTCPVCHADLRPASTLDNIERLKVRLREAGKACAERKAQVDAKNKAKAKINWLVKIEYHT